MNDPAAIFEMNQALGNGVVVLAYVDNEGVTRYVSGILTSMDVRREYDDAMDWQTGDIISRRFGAATLNLRIIQAEGITLEEAAASQARRAGFSPHVPLSPAPSPPKPRKRVMRLGKENHNGSANGSH